MGDGLQSGPRNGIILNWRRLFEVLVGGLLAVIIAVGGWMGVQLLGHDRTLVGHEERIKAQEKMTEDHANFHERMEARMNLEFDKINTKLDTLRDRIKP